MPRINTEALQEKMVVAADVKNLDNMLLIPAGSALTSRHIDILQAWGVTDVEITEASNDGDQGDPLLQLPPEALAEITAGLKRRFWQFDESNQAAVHVFDLMLRRKVRQFKPA